ncbi:hypothetical protein E4U38_003707 [Claviceps purpurea]|nr:hypothetical protein E4U38_003707 [Claviceps purpurea]
MLSVMPAIDTDVKSKRCMQDYDMHDATTPSSVKKKYSDSPTECDCRLVMSPATHPLILDSRPRPRFASQLLEAQTKSDELSSPRPSTGQIETGATADRVDSSINRNE